MNLIAANRQTQHNPFVGSCLGGAYVQCRSIIKTSKYSKHDKPKADNQYTNHTRNIIFQFLLYVLTQSLH